MSQVTIYLDESLADRLRLAAERDGVSVSRWVAQVIADRTADTWPAEVLALAGTWADAPPIRPAHSDDVARPTL